MGRVGRVNRALDEPYIRSTFGLYSIANKTSDSAKFNLDNLLRIGCMGLVWVFPFLFLGFSIRLSSISFGQLFGIGVGFG